MGNHFHLFIRILGEEEIKPFAELPPENRLKTSPTPSYILPLSGPATADGVGWSSTADGVGVNLRKPKPSTQLSHLFNSYAQYYNKKYQRKGVLFEKGFRRKIVDDPDYLTNLIDYIHNNPVRHRFVNCPGEYPWSSFTSNWLFQPKPLHAPNDLSGLNILVNNEERIKRI